VLRARATLAAVLATCISLALTGPAAAADRDKQSVVDRIVAKADPKLMEVVVATSRGDDRPPRISTIKVPDVAAAKRVVSDLLGRPSVERVEMNGRYRALGFNDPYYANQWALDYRHFYFDKIWQITKYDQARPYVAVIDTGVQLNHPDLVGHLASGINFVSPGSAPSDGYGHGTHVAGIIAAAGNNGTGVVGMAQRAWIRPVKVLDDSGEGTTATVVQGIYWAADHAHILNMSFGAGAPSGMEQDAIDYAYRKGRVLVAAGGNHDDRCPLVGTCYRNAPSYPAAYSGVVGVAAVDPSWKPASFSNYGSWVDVAAPGVNVVSTIPGGYEYMSGTSMATPYVSAEAVLAIQHCHWSGSTVRSKLQTTASNYPTKYSTIGYGIIRPLQLLRCQ
jgi:thermitase